MYILHVNNAAAVAKLNKHIDNGSHVFMLIYMEGCGPCNATRPEWAALEKTLGFQYSKNHKLVVADINKDVAHLIHKIPQPNSFPTMIYVSQNGNNIEKFEESSINDKSRNTDCFMNWIEGHVSKMELISSNSHISYKKARTNTHKKHKGTRKHHKNKSSTKHNKSKALYRRRKM
jgi:thiol-disulfide isomerase/thioredoxin